LNKTVIIIGIDSLIGNALGIAAEKTGYEVFGTSRRKNSEQKLIDVTWKLDRWPDLPECDALVVCASLNKLEQCRNDPSLSYAVNIEGLEKAIKKYKSSRTKLIFFSSSQVFNGKKSFCKEDELLDPQNVLGEHKALGEEIVLNEGGLVVRVTKVIDPCFPRFTDWVHRFKNGVVVEAYTNLLASLVPLETLVNVLLAAIQEDWCSIIHISGPEDKSYYDMARSIAKNFRFSDDFIIPVQGETDNFGRSYSHTTLKLSQLVKDLNVDMPDTETVIKRWSSYFMSDEMQCSFDTCK